MKGIMGNIDNSIEFLNELGNKEYALKELGLKDFKSLFPLNTFESHLEVLKFIHDSLIN